jgi:3,4-dihydroxy 2-butanone 4-phosphate synthase/GTP cyclohydrolase II
VKGSVAGRSDLPVHVHRECYASTVPGSTTCTCRARLRQSLAAVEAAGAGVVIQIRGEDGALDDHAPPRSSDLAIAARILEDLGLEPACVRPPGFGSAAA